MLVDALLDIKIVPPEKLNELAEALTLYLPAISKVPPSTVSVPPFGAKSSLLALPRSTYPEVTRRRPFKPSPALKLISAVGELSQIPEVA